MGKSARKSYKELLLDPQWQRKRLEILQRSDFSCESCGRTERTLHVHHKSYRAGAAPWEYENEELESLCEPCHGRAHSLRDRLKVLASRMTDGELSKLVGFAEAAIVGYAGENIHVGPGWESLGGVASYFGTSPQKINPLVRDGEIKVSELLTALRV